MNVNVNAVRRVRYEMMYKTESELRARVRALTSRYGARVSINLPNKVKHEDVMSYVDVVRDIIADVDVVAHYSVKNNYVTDCSACAMKVRAFAMKLCDRGITRALLVSGSAAGGRRANDAVEILRRLATDREHEEFRRDSRRLGFLFECAFNPYFPKEEDLEREYARLEKKLASGLVGGIWLQLGSDCDALERALVRVKELCARSTDAPVRMHGSVFVPSNQLLARMRFRPWNGVFLSKEYLSSVKSAEEITMKQLKIFARHGVIPFIESGLATDEDFQRCERLLSAYDVMDKVETTSGESVW